VISGMNAPPAWEDADLNYQSSDLRASGELATDN